MGGVKGEREGERWGRGSEKEVRRVRGAYQMNILEHNYVDLLK